MKINNSNNTEETGEKLRFLMPSELKEKNIILNIGDSNFINNSGDALILNKADAVLNCVDKKRMFNALKKNNIKCLEYLDLNKCLDKLKGIFYLCLQKELVLRGSGKLKVISFKDIKYLFKDAFNYATIKENKLMEYRIIIFKDRIIRLMFKFNNKNDFALKQYNSKFIDADINKIPLEEILNLINAAKCLDIDLCGIDFLINTKGKFKVIEVNSGMSMNKKSIDAFYIELNNWLKENQNNIMPSLQ